MSEDFTVIMPSMPPSLPNFRDIFLPHKRKTKEESHGYAVSRFFSTPPFEYLCAFCQNVVKKPLECKKCGKLYCDSCSYNLHKIDESNGSRSFSCMACGSPQEPRHLYRGGSMEEERAILVLRNAKGLSCLKGWLMINSSIKHLLNIRNYLRILNSEKDSFDFILVK